MASANLSSVSVDDVSASSLMIEHLYAQGHRKIGLIGGKPDQSRPSLSRLTGCQSAMFRLGLPFEMEKQYAYARFSLQSGYTAMEYLLKHCPDITAVFAMSDLMALGAIRALQGGNGAHDGLHHDHHSAGHYPVSDLPEVYH